jgi:hypothetical protein
LSRFFYIFLGIVAFCFRSFSQEDLNKQLQNNKWFVKGDFKSKTMTFTKKPEPKTAFWQANFLKSGRMLRCDSIHESSFDYEGKEYKSDRFVCDSSGNYQVNKDIMHISGGINHYYYKVKAVENSFEFTATDSESFYKK